MPFLVFPILNPLSLLDLQANTFRKSDFLIHYRFILPLPYHFQKRVFGKEFHPKALRLL